MRNIKTKFLNFQFKLIYRIYIRDFYFLITEIIF